MPETVEFLKEEGMIKVESFGKVNIQDWNASLEKVNEIGERENCRIVLVDVSKQESRPDTLEVFQFGEEMTRDFRFAVVTSTGVSEEHKFLETVAVNRGKYVRLFDEYEKAINWLGEFA